MKDGRNARYRWQVSWLTAWHFARLPDRSQWHEGIVRRLQLRGQPGRWRDSPHPIPFSSASCTCTQNHRRQDYSPARLKNSVPSPPPSSSPLARGTPHLMWPTIAHQRFIPAGAGNTSSHGLWWERRPVHPRWRGVHCSTCVYSCRPDGSSPLARGTPYLKHPEFLRQRFIPAGAGNTQAPSLSWRPAPVHPRWRGEHLSLNSQTANLYGSSPLARGTPGSAYAPAPAFRFIPAGAGNTVKWWVRGDLRAVHPRWRGEHDQITGGFIMWVGSSPLARGTLSFSVSWATTIRFIPAGAGNTSSAAHRSAAAAVHPRWRGEHIPLEREELLADGSSPLARGTHRSRLRRLVLPRFIPAGAGNTLTKRAALCGLSVHPRWRGEHVQFTGAAGDGEGSSPLARGTPLDYICTHSNWRFIPAGAGNTLAVCALTLGVTVHPRWRGEHASSECMTGFPAGSSPLARGTLIPFLDDATIQRFIPAGAGNTKMESARKQSHAVHPRWRGEHSGCHCQALLCSGSSPLARGTPCRGPRSLVTRRFIPAGAGNTRGF